MADEGRAAELLGGVDEADAVGGLTGTRLEAAAVEHLGEHGAVGAGLGRAELDGRERLGAGGGGRRGGGGGDDSRRVAERLELGGKRTLWSSAEELSRVGC